MNFDDLLSMGNSTLEDVCVELVKRKVDENLYTINLNDAKDGVYSARVRFLPNPENTKKSIVSKYYYWLTDANEENGMYIDDPSTIGEKSPIGDLYWKLKKSANPVDVNMSELLKRNRRFFSLVQIIEDDQHPELIGQIKVFAYGIKIKEKIDEEFADKDGGNPFDITNAREFKIKVKKVGGFQNYDACNFTGGLNPITIEGKEFSKTASDMKRLEEFFSAAPSLDSYEFVPWTAEQTEQVNERLRTFTNNGGGVVSGSAPKAVVEKAIAQEEDYPADVEDSIPFNDGGDDDDLLAGIDI